MSGYNKKVFGWQRPPRNRQEESGPHAEQRFDFYLSCDTSPARENVQLSTRAHLSSHVPGNGCIWQGFLPFLRSQGLSYFTSYVKKLASLLFPYREETFWIKDHWRAPKGTIFFTILRDLNLLEILCTVLQLIMHLKLFQNEKLTHFKNAQKTKTLGVSTFPHLLKIQIAFSSLRIFSWHLH